MTDRPRPLFSVLLLVHGPGANVAEAWGSVEAQAIDLEMIVIDDSPSDQVRAELDRLATATTLSTRIIETNGIGRLNAWNVGAQTATGKYLALLDAQDEYHHDRLDAFRRADLICGGFAWGFSGVDAIDSSGRPLILGTVRNRELRSAIETSTKPIKAVRQMPWSFTPVSSGNMVIDTETFRAAGGFAKYTQLFDWDLALRLFRRCDPITIERPLYRYRVHPQEASSDVDATRRARARAEQEIAIQEDFWQGLSDDGIEETSIARMRQGRPMPRVRRGSFAGRPAQWAVDQLRRAPFLYRTVWRATRLIERLQRRYQ